jgi:arylsulfatase A-like enzyme
MGKMKSNLVAKRAFGGISRAGKAGKALACLAAMWGLHGGLEAAEGKPNIIFILADDLGYGDLGSYGQTKVQTPALDQMAKEGMRFTQFYAGATVCAPSRSVLLTGLHGGHTAVRALPYHAVPPYKDGEPPIPASAPSLGTLAKDAGYSTAIIGKWGLGAVGSEGDPNKQGFDLAYGYIDHGEAHNYYPKFLWRNGAKEPASGYSHDRFTEEALKFLNTNKDKPFFIYLPYTIPHFNLNPPSVDPYAEKDWPQVGKQRAAMITRLDRDVGRILDELKKLGIADNTLVLFTSDNGPTPESGAPLELFNSAGGLRGIKRDLYEGGIRVPLIAWWPGTVPSDTTSDFVGSFCDVLPTLAQVEGVPIPPGMDGVSMLPELKGKHPEQQQHTVLYWETVEKGGAQAVRMGRWKGVLKGICSKSPGKFELYDLNTDPAEKTDLAAQHPEQVKILMEAIKKEHVTSPIFPLNVEERQAAQATTARVPSP